MGCCRRHAAFTQYCSRHPPTCSSHACLVTDNPTTYHAGRIRVSIVLHPRLPIACILHYTLICTVHALTDPLPLLYTAQPPLPGLMIARPLSAAARLWHNKQACLRLEREALRQLGFKARRCSQLHLGQQLRQQHLHRSWMYTAHACAMCVQCVFEAQCSAGQPCEAHDPCACNRRAAGACERRPSALLRQARATL